jgi:GGDEF domain-containing protein
MNRQVEPSLPNPLEYGFFDPKEQILFYQKAMAGHHAATLLMGNLMQETATHDALTGVLNLRGFREVIDLMEPDELQNYAVLYGDCTNFKAINDRISHEKGDEVLVKTTTNLTESLRKGSLIARVGGDEFMALIYVGTWGAPDREGRRQNQLTPGEQTQYTRERIERGMQQILAEDPAIAEQGYGFSVGVAHPAPGIGIEELKSLAEAEMMQHKAAQHDASGQYRVVGVEPATDS